MSALPKTDAEKRLERVTRPVIKAVLAYVDNDISTATMIAEDLYYQGLLYEVEPERIEL